MYFTAPTFKKCDVEIFQRHNIAIRFFSSNQILYNITEVRNIIICGIAMIVFAVGILKVVISSCLSHQCGVFIGWYTSCCCLFINVSAEPTSIMLLDNSKALFFDKIITQGMWSLFLLLLWLYTLSRRETNITD